MRPLFPLLLAAALAGTPAGAADINAGDAQARELSDTESRIMTSLFFRGEVADKILEGGKPERFIDTTGIETYADLRSAMMEWVKRNPEKAAQAYLGIKGAGGRLPTSIESRRTVWEINPKFLELVKALNAAAGSASVSREEMELAARRLYGGEQAAADAPVMLGGGGGGPAAAGRDPGFADFRLNRAGLEAELGKSAEWLEAVKPASGEGKAASAYRAAFSVYREFVVAASELKGRQVVTRNESARLESMRARLRSALASLALYSRAASLSAAARPLSGTGSRPGEKQMLAALQALAAELESAAGSLRAGDLAALGRLVNDFEGRFARLYLGYTVYDGLLNLSERSAPRGFSCLLDYAAYGFLAAFFPDSGYVRARAELQAAAKPLGEALGLAASGDPAAALALVDVKRLETAVSEVRSASAHNRAAQFFTWGLVFRPVELRLEFRGGRPRFTPAFTMFEVAAKK